MTTRRIPLIAGNWKMNGAVAESVALARAVADGAPGGCELLVCPPAVLIPPVAAALKGGNVAVGGQDCHFAESGAHTGDIAAAMLTDAGCGHVILGHSERRADHGESDELVRLKTEAAHTAGLIAVVCVGETLEERDGGAMLARISSQIEGSLPAAITAKNTVIAYEPVWAIGTGRTPTAADVEEVHTHIRGDIERRFGAAVAGGIRILYGGSMKPSNAVELLAIDGVDGGLIGGASLKAEDFLAIAASCP
jgi:triosephosphate isomerase